VAALFKSPCIHKFNIIETQSVTVSTVHLAFLLFIFVAVWHNLCHLCSRRLLCIRLALLHTHTHTQLVQQTVRDILLANNSNFGHILHCFRHKCTAMHKTDASTCLAVPLHRPMQIYVWSLKYRNLGLSSCHCLFS